MKTYTSSGWTNAETGKGYHYGIEFDLSKPVGGVVNSNRIEWDINDAIDLGYEEREAEFEREQKEHSESCPLCENQDECPEWEQMQQDHEYGDDCCEGGPYLLGSWKKDAEGMYEPDESGEYAAYIGEIYTQVCWSRRVEKRAMCSICFPGQGDCDTEGDVLTYCLPKDMLWGEDEDDEDTEEAGEATGSEAEEAGGK